VSPIDPNHADAERDAGRKLDRRSARIFGRNGSITVRSCISPPASRRCVPNAGEEGTDLFHKSNIKRRGQIGDLRRLHKFKVAALERYHLQASQPLPDP
jgi:hypothetical protein